MAVSSGRVVRLARSMAVCVCVHCIRHSRPQHSTQLDTTCRSPSRSECCLCRWHPVAPPVLPCVQVSQWQEKCGGKNRMYVCKDFIKRKKAYETKVNYPPPHSSAVSAGAHTNPPKLTPTHRREAARGIVCHHRLHLTHQPVRFFHTP